MAIPSSRMHADQLPEYVRMDSCLFPCRCIIFAIGLRNRDFNNAMQGTLVNNAPMLGVDLHD
jgi:hypothetical protein